MPEDLDFFARWNKRREEESSKETAEDIVQHFTFVIEEDIYEPTTAAVATAMLKHLTEQLQSITDANDRLNFARMARGAFRKIAAENQHKYVIHCIETEWESWRALFHYQRHPEDRPADSKYSLEEIANYQEEGQKPQGIAPVVDDTEEI